jgi:hypothetical protein
VKEDPLSGLPCAMESVPEAISPPSLRSARVLTGLYSAFSNPVLERLGYGMANMRPARRGGAERFASPRAERDNRFASALMARRCLFCRQVRRRPMGRRWRAPIFPSGSGQDRLPADGNVLVNAAIVLHHAS